MCARVLVWVGFLAAELFVGYKLIIDLWFCLDGIGAFGGGVLVVCWIWC